ncbi:MAG: hypothetical protein EBQ96_00815 [Proteobacteria bacterium]|nr:hypothetical protein [Pseudomonadota bacterium]
MRVFSREKRDSAVAAAAYRAGQNLVDDRLAITHDFRNRSKAVAASFILAPPDAPEKTHNRALLWNAAEAAETRKNSRVARELILALPHELSAAFREALARDMGLWMVERYRVVVDVSIHQPTSGHDPRNHHAHLLFTTREVTKDGFGRKTRILDDKEKGPEEIELVRAVWETLVNDALEREGFPEAKIDRRTLEDQGIDRIPQVHIGPEAKAIEERLKEDEEEESKKEDEDDKDGKGKKGKGGNGDGKQNTPNNAKAGDDGKGHKPDYQKIDQDRSRPDLAKEIKAVNTERAKWPDTPLGKQIRALEVDMSRLDTRLKHYERLEAKTRLSGVVRSAIGKAVKFSKDILAGRIERRRALRLTELEKQIRINRQKERYKRTYREGIHAKLKDMHIRLDILKGTHTDYQNYKKFVDSIDRALAAQPVKPTFERQSRIITNQEHSLKLKLKAALVRENVLERFRPPNPPRLSKATASPIRAVIERSQRQQARGESEQQRQPVPRQEPQKPTTSSLFNTKAAQTRPVPILTHQQVRAKSEKIVSDIRQNIPPKYKAQPYPPKTPKAAKMSGKFNKAGFGAAAKPRNGPKAKPF